MEPLMISYRTLVFGTIAVIAAAAPAYADSVAAVPGPVHTMDSVAAVPKAQTMDSVAAVPKAAAKTSTTTTHTSFVTSLAETFVQFEHFVLRISH
jgi:hypothetical protein